MTFFVTSAGLGKGGDLGGLAGADVHCQALAVAIEGQHFRADNAPLLRESCEKFGEP
jgi:hypothetical protein